MKMTDHIVDSVATSELSRRKVLMLLGGSLLSLAIVPRRSLAASTGFTASAGGDIPAATVRLGIEPYGDHSTLVIGIRQGFFKDVGIDIEPQPLGESTQLADVVPRLASGSLDIVTWYGPIKVAALANTSNLTMLGFVDVYIGTYILAAPWTKAKPVNDFVSQGKPFSEAVTLAIDQMKGKRVALANDGAHRDFFNTVFALGGIKTSDVSLQALEDNEQVQLANSGRLDYASPSGAAQTVQLMNQGWYRLVGTEDLLNGLPAGDPRAVATIGDTGPACTRDFLDKHYETVLRFMSVMFRVIDQVKADPTKALGYEAPYLRSVAGTNTTPEDLGKIMKTLDPLIAFEEQTRFWTDTSSPYYYKNVYTPQIEAAKRGGIIPSGVSATADDVTVGARVYNDLVGLKNSYDLLLPKAGSVSEGARSTIANAATQYQNRNYLDAYRLLKSAVG
jgi:ABC-type nitrate/sulfonate/bicarbonate transport system substrate-binding protein